MRGERREEREGGSNSIQNIYSFEAALAAASRPYHTIIAM
jgi:hypothetical protein